MKFQYILNSISLLANKHKGSLYKITKESGYLLLAVLFIKSVPAIETDGINNIHSSQYPPITDYRCLVEPTYESNCVRYINLATAATQREFDYDPGMLPEVAEAIFALRVKHANADEPFVINLSGNYLLKFTKDRIYILDTYTKNSDVYEYQSTNPNITIGLVVSKGLPDNYKSIVIKEDAHGQIYDYAALRSDNISTDETMLSETLSHPFYEVAGKDGVEDKVTISKAMAFYKEQPSHKRPPRCVKSSSSVLKQFMEILGSGNPVCGPNATADIRSANHQSADEMKLDQPLVEAKVNTSKYPERLGYRLRERVDLNGENPLAILVAAERCQMSVMTIIGDLRKKRAVPDLANCRYWVHQMMELYISLDLKFSDLYQIVESVKQTNDIPASYFPGGQYPPGKEGNRTTLVKIILGHINQAAEVLQIGAAELGEAAGASAFVQCPDEPQACGESAASGRGIEIYTLNEQQLIPEPNKVKILKKINRQTSKVFLLDGEQYSTKVIYLGNSEQKTDIQVHNNISSYIEIIGDWINKIKKRVRRLSKKKREIFYESREIAISIYRSLSGWNDSQDLVISVVYHDQDLIGISIGRIDERVYYPMHHIVSPESLFGEHESISGQLTYLRSEVLKYLFSNGLIDRSELAVISIVNTGHDEL